MVQANYTLIEQWYNQRFHQGFFQGLSGGKIRYSISIEAGADRAIVIVTGRTEFIEKYKEICWDLRNTGCSICLLDHFGQGGSGRALDDFQKGHIDDFQSYVNDLEYFVNTIVLAEKKQPIILLSHSMGGTISTLFLEKNQQEVAGLILVSPMLQINTGTVLQPLLVEKIVDLVCAAGGRHRYVWGGGPFNAELSFSGNELTTDEGRFEHNLELLRCMPELAVGSPTFGWLQQSYRAMRRARKLAHQLSCPILLLKGGRDRVVSLPAMSEFCRNVGECREILFPEARHEVLMEADSIRNEALKEIRNFVSSL